MWNGSVMLCETEWVTDCDNQDLPASQDLIGRKVAYGWSHVGFICTFWMKKTLLEFYVALLWQPWFGAMHADPNPNGHLGSSNNHVK